MSGTDLPQTAHSITHKGALGGHEYYLTVAFYESGRPGQLFIKLSKEGSTMRGFADVIALTASLALQNGVPWTEIRERWEKFHFEPLDHDFSSLPSKWAHDISQILSANAQSR